MLGVLSSTVGRSADAMVMSQAVAIAEAYLEEISLKAFADPDGVDGETTRAAFDDVDDYNGLVDNGARDQFGTALVPLCAVHGDRHRGARARRSRACRARMPSASTCASPIPATAPSRSTGYKTRL